MCVCLSVCLKGEFRTCLLLTRISLVSSFHTIPRWLFFTWRIPFFALVSIGFSSILLCSNVSNGTLKIEMRWAASFIITIACSLHRNSLTNARKKLIELTFKGFQYEITKKSKSDWDDPIWDNLPLLFRWYL